MLMESSVDPFTAQEAKPYKNDPEVQAMTNLVEAYQQNDINDFEKILRTERYVAILMLDTLFIEERSVFGN